MAKQLKITRKAARVQKRVWSAKDLETDPCDESTGASSHWQDMVENMELEIVHTKDGVKSNWKYKGG